VNKIKKFYKEGQLVQKGEKISFIERGSQTDLFIPYTMNVGLAFLDNREVTRWN